MSDNTFKVIIIILLLLFIGIIIWWFGWHVQVPDNNSDQILIEKLDSIQKRLDKIEFKRDSIKAVIDTTKVKINIVHETYKTTVERIINQPLDSDQVFLTDYLNGYLDSFNANTVKNP